MTLDTYLRDIWEVTAMLFNESVIAVQGVKTMTQVYEVCVIKCCFDILTF